MDILAHMLWANYGSRVANKIIRKKDRKINLPWVTFWGVFPDLFAFTIPFVVLMFSAIKNGFTFVRPTSFGLAAYLYQYSHSIVIWSLVFSLVWVIAKKPRLELLGWLLHILIDIPSHSASFYPTPFLFPISNYKFMHGISWSNTWYMIINYGLLLVLTFYFFHKNKKKSSV